MIEAQADGYASERRTNQVGTASEVTLDFALLQAPAAAGMVLTPEGTPAAGAALIVCGRDESGLLVGPGRFQLDWPPDQASAIADAQGRFRLPSKFAPEAVVVAHRSGLAELPYGQITSNCLVQLQPWGRIEGTVQLGGRPVSGERIQVTTRPWRVNPLPHLGLFLETRSDRDGRFVFELVPPGEWKIQREICPRTPDSLAYALPAPSHDSPVLVTSGQMATVALGGAGRAVVGHVLPSAPLPPGVWTANAAALILKSSASGAPEFPPARNYPNEAAHQDAVRAFQEQCRVYWSSEAGRAEWRRPGEYRGLFGPDGSFRIDDVLAGEYTLVVNLVEPPKVFEGNRPAIRKLGALEMAVVIPEADPDSNAAPADLGALALGGPAAEAAR